MRFKMTLDQLQAERDQAIGIANTTAKERDIWKADANSWEKDWRKLHEAAKPVAAITTQTTMADAEQRINELRKAMA